MNIEDLIKENGRVPVTTAAGHTFMLPLKELVNQTPPVPDLDRFLPQTYHFQFAEIMNGQDPRTVGDAWIDSFRLWGVRHLEGNDDQGIKRHVPGVTHMHDADGMTLLAQPHDGEIVAGMISAEDFASYVPGTRFELEFRLNQISKGQHFAAWLLPVDGSWPPETDMLELVNSPSEIYFASHHVDGSQGGPLTKMQFGGVGEWHKLTLDWMDQRTVWKLDGDIVRDVPTSDFTKPMYPLFSWEIGQDGEKSWPQGPDETTVWPASITLKSLRISRL